MLLISFNSCCILLVTKNQKLVFITASSSHKTIIQNNYESCLPSQPKMPKIQRVATINDINLLFLPWVWAFSLKKKNSAKD